jgi:hypothetical protein
MGDKRNSYKMFVGNREREILLGNPRHRWEDNIKIDLGVGCGLD